MRSMVTWLKVALALWMLKIPFLRSKAKRFFETADFQAIRWLQTYVERKEATRRTRLDPLIYALCFAPGFLGLLSALAGLDEAIQKSWRIDLWDLVINPFFGVLFLCLVGYGLHFVCSLLLIDTRVVRASEALAISGKLTPNAIVCLLESLNEKKLKAYTPLIAQKLAYLDELIESSNVSQYDFQERLTYQKAIPSLKKHLSLPRINDNLPLALALAHFFAYHGDIEAYPWLSLSVSRPPSTPAEEAYVSQIAPLVSEMERSHFPDPATAWQRVRSLPAGYSHALLENERLAVHALACLLPRIHPDGAELSHNDFLGRLLRYLNSDPFLYPHLHLAIINFVRRGQLLKAIPTLKKVSLYRGNSKEGAREQVRDAAQIALTELEKIAEEKRTASTLLRAGVFDEDLLRASERAPQEEAAEMLLRKGSEE